MRWDVNTITVICVVLGTLVTIVGAVRSFVRTGREQRAAIATELQNAKESSRQDGYNRGQQDARAELNPEIQLLQSRLEDAKRDRDIQQERADRLEADLRTVWSNRRSGNE